MCATPAVPLEPLHGHHREKATSQKRFLLSYVRFILDWLRVFINQPQIIHESGRGVKILYSGV
jgi:hypothetical protein